MSEYCSLIGQFKKCSVLIGHCKELRALIGQYLDTDTSLVFISTNTSLMLSILTGVPASELCSLDLHFQHVSESELTNCLTTTDEEENIINNVIEHSFLPISKHSPRFATKLIDLIWNQ